MKKSLFSGVVAIFLVCISLQLVLAINLDVSKKTISGTVISEVNEPAVFNLTITNRGPADDFEIYSLVKGVDVLPNGNFHLNAGETKSMEVSFYIDEQLRERTGIINFVYKIRGSSSGIQDYTQEVAISNFKDAVQVSAETITPDSLEAKVYVQNKIDLKFSDMKVNLRSVFFEKEEEFALNPLEKKELVIPLDKDKLRGLVAGNYLLTGDFDVKNFKQSLEGSIRFAEKSDLTTSEKSSGIIFREKTVEKINDGNVLVLAEVKMSKDIISRLFTRFSPEPSKVDRKTLSVDYTWSRELKPGEKLTVKVSTNYLYPLLLIILVVVAAYLVFVYSSSALNIKKRVSFVRTKGGEFALKVTLNVSSRKFVEKISIVDRFPGIVKLYERFGAFTPDKIDEKNRRLEWNIESLQPGEERVFSYIIYSKIGVVGRFELSPAVGVFERDGKIYETTSNKAFFMNETRRREED